MSLHCFTYGRLLGRFTIPCILALLALTSQQAFAAVPSTGSLYGRILNADTGMYLNHARVTIPGTPVEAFTDESGEYRLSGLPVGEVNLRVFYTGLNLIEQAVEVTAGGEVRRDFQLSRHSAASDSKTLRLADMMVTAEKQMTASAIAINEQRFAGNMKTVMSSDTFGDSVDGNVGEFIKNMPGVSVDYDGAEVANVSVRGFASAYTPVTIDGDRMASATPDSTRAISLNQAALVNVARIEVIKGSTPDISAESLGGSVNMVSKSAFEMAKPQFNYRVLTNFNSEHATLSKTPQPKREPTLKIKPGADFSYTVPVSKNFGFTLNGLYSDQFYPQRSTRPEWNPKSPGSLTAPYFNKYQFQESPKTSKRIGIGGKIDWRVTRDDVLTFGLQFNDSTRMSSTHNMALNNGGRLRVITPAQGTTPAVLDFGPTHAHSEVGRGTLDYGGSNQLSDDSTTNISLGHTHRGSVWTIDDKIYYSHSTSQKYDVGNGNFETVNLRQSNLTVDFDEIGPLRPGKISVRDASGAAVDPYSMAGKTLLEVNSKEKRAKDTFGGAKLNVSRDLGLAIPFQIKGGGSIDRQERDIYGPSRKAKFVGPDGKPLTADDNAALYDVLDPDAVSPGWGLPRVEWPSNYKVYDLYKAHPEYFLFDEVAYAVSKTEQSYNLKETITAGYLMGDTRLMRNRLRVMGGVRYEHTKDRSLGGLKDPTQAFQRNAQGELILVNGQTVLKNEVLPANDPTGEVRAKLVNIPRGAKAQRSYADFYPSLHGTYSFTENLIGRVSFARTLGRPDLDKILPNTSINNTTRIITANNAALDPWESNNYDVALEYYFSKVGMVSFGVFRKDLSNYFGKISTPMTPELLEKYGLGVDFADYTVATLSNVGDVRVDGMEFSYQQSLSFLPDWGKGISVYGNATLLDIEGSDTADMKGFIPRSYNWGFSYDNRRVNLQLKWNYRGKQRNSKLSWGTDPEGFEYILARLTLDVNAEFRLTKRTTLFVNVRNLANVPVETERTAPGLPSYASLYRVEEFGAQYGVGVKGRF